MFCLFKRSAIWLCLLGMAASAHAFDPEKDVKVSFSKGAIAVAFPPSTHLSAPSVEVALKSKPGILKVGPMPKADGKDEAGEPIFRKALRIPIAAEGLKDPVKVEVTYQACVEGEGGACYPPTSQVLTVKASDIPAVGTTRTETAPKVDTPAKAGTSALETAPAEPVTAEATKAAATPAPVAKAASTPSKPASRGLLALLAVAFLAGLGASLTPCVYPMIPITMAIIGTKGGGKAKGFLLSLSLVLGMAVTYTLLGIFAAVSGATFGSFAQHPAFLIPVSVLFGLFSLSLFGVFELDLPEGLKAKLQGSGPRKGFGGAFVMGLVLGPLAAPCVGPIVASILVAIAQQGAVAAGGMQLFVFALGMGVLFMVVGTFSAGLPRSGDWLTKLKYLMGVVVLGFAAWNVRLLAPEWLNATMWAVVLLVAAVVLGAFKIAEELGSGLQKAVALVLLVVGILVGVKAVEAGMDINLLPKATGAVVKGEAASSLWIENDLEAAKAKAKAEKKLLVVDTYTSWCAQCKELDHKTWPAPAVTEWLKANAIAVRIECEKGRPELQKALDIKSYPTVILLDAEGRELRRTFGFKSPDAMLLWLKGGN